METKAYQPLDFQRPIPRSTLLLLLRTGLKLKEYRFVRQAALAWLAAFNGDLLVNFYLAQALVEEGRAEQAVDLLERLLELDPEFMEAYALRGRITQPAADSDTKILGDSLLALGRTNGSKDANPVWAKQAAAARQAFLQGDMTTAEEKTMQALVAEPASPIPAILHLRIIEHKQDYAAVFNLASLYNQRWPNCLAFQLYLADAQIRLNDETSAVALLHQCVSLDAAAQVPQRIWTSQHPYRPLWPERMEARLDLPVPAAIAAELGWNQLPQGEIAPVVEPEALVEQDLPGEPGADSAQGKGLPGLPGLRIPTIPNETLRAIQEEFERLARRLRKPEVGRSDGRFPIYVVLTTKAGLEGQYGPQTTAVIQSELRRLVEVIRRRPNWGAMVFTVDDPAATAAYGVKPAPANDPWKIKLALADLDAALGKKGEMIGALLIVGGPQVVPFHKLPNPTDDGDADVSSDNPYASLDDNYFVPEWLIGRLPGGNGSDAGMLLNCLRKIVAYHTHHTRPVPWWKQVGVLRQTVKQIKSFANPKSTARMKTSFGYTAAIWKQSSIAVFRPIGEAQSMLVSPPGRTGFVTESGLMPASLTYFNLHGLPDSPDWYGQKDTNDSSDGPDYPVAMSPKDVLNHGQAPRMVFTEACYGALVENKSEEQALSLKFLASGTLAVVGSTCIAYGTVTTPLIAADLLGETFWKGLRSGLTVGEAFQQAKIHLVQVMNSRQGYLDGEDQKTLISFVLYGDPLVTLDEMISRQKTVLRLRPQPVVKTISDDTARQEESDEEPVISSAVIAQVKKIVDQYLPGLENAEMHFTTPAGVVVDDPLGIETGAAPKQVHLPKTSVSLSKQVRSAAHTHQHYARLTLDERGKVLKVAVSR